jgi:hypothetical protein
MSSLAACVLCASTLLGQTGIEAPAVPSEIVEELDYFVGNWKVSGEGPLGPIEGSWSAEWSPGKVCLLIHYPGPDPEEFLGKGIFGWNSQKKEILAQMFYSIGAHETISYKVGTSGSWEASYSGALNGKPFKADAILNKSKPDVWSFDTKNLILDGETVKDFSVRFVRAEEIQPTTMPVELRRQIDERLIGQWTYEVTWGEKEFTGEETTRWIGRKNGILIQGNIMVDGSRINYAMMQGWDGSVNALVGRGFTSDGESSTGCWTDFSEEKWTGHGEGIYQGKRWKSPSQLEFLKDSLRYEDVTQGKPWVAVYKRKLESAKTEK